MLFRDNLVRTRYTGNFLSKVKTEDYNVMINKRKFFDKLVKYDLRTYDNIQNFANGQGIDYTTGRLIDYPYFK